MNNLKKYWDSDFFKFENDNLKKSWIYAGLTTDIYNHNDFFSFELFGQSYFTQNLNGEILTFENKCAHRHSKIHLEKYGNRSMTCMYHGWSYGEDGNILNKNIQNKFPEKCLSLNKIRTNVCGKFIFINIVDSQLTLNEYLGPFFQELLVFSDFFNKKQFQEDLFHKCNWKLIIENVLECYHCSTVHKNTFIPMGIGREKMVNYFSFNGHNKCEYPKIFPEKLSKKEVFVEEVLQNRLFKHNSYLHYFIFPNLLLSSTEGKSFYVGKLEFVDPVSTNLNYKLFSPTFDDSTVIDELMIDSIAEYSMISTKKILLEDLNVLESQQLNITGKEDNQMYLDDEEIRILDFFCYYNKFLHG